MSEFKECSELRTCRRKVEYIDETRAFVDNLGLLLAQTREGIRKVKFYPADGVVHMTDVAVISFTHGQQVAVNVECDSWTAIIRDVMKHI